MNKKYKPILIIDFDGTLTQYKEWKGIDIIDDEPVEGAMKFLVEASEFFTINIFSSRSSDPKGIGAMQQYIERHLKTYLEAYMRLPEASHQEAYETILARIQWPVTKPAGFLSIDDRALPFEGDWSKFVPEELIKFKPWNKR